MGNTLCKDQADTRPKTRGLIVWGDYVNAETKAILSVLTICNIEH